MSKKENITANTTANNITTAPAREWDGPAHATLESVIIGSTDKALGVGVMDATGKDGATTGYLVSLARTRPNGKKVIYPLQDLMKDMPKAFARTYNAYTKLYKTRLEALHKCASLAAEYNWEMLDAEKEEVATLKASGKWKVEKTSDKKAPKTDNERIGARNRQRVGRARIAPLQREGVSTGLNGLGGMMTYGCARRAQKGQQSPFQPFPRSPSPSPFTHPLSFTLYPSTLKGVYTLPRILPIV